MLRSIGIYGTFYSTGDDPDKGKGSQQIMVVTDDRDEPKPKKWDAVLNPKDKVGRILRIFIRPSCTSVIGKWTLRLKTKLKDTNQFRWYNKEKVSKADEEDDTDNLVYILFNPFCDGKRSPILNYYPSIF